jgi:aryl-alcohol dehydrogenase-like predicted oxidoreductase
METIDLGGVQVSALAFGAMRLGTLQDEKQSFALLDRYVEAGGTFIDTANNYSFWYPGGKGGESETVLGKWMGARGNRSRLFLASKVGFNTPEPGHSLSRRTINAEVEKSLRRLGTDTIDLYYAHKDHRPDPLEETLEAFDALKRFGKIRLAGCSNTAAWRLERARALSRERGWLAYCCVQQRHTYLRPAPGASFGNQLAADDSLLDYCRENPDLRLLSYSPLLAGAYTRTDKPVPFQYRGPDTDARLEALRAVAAEVGATVNQVVLAWMLRGSPRVLPVFSASSVEQMNENLGAVAVRLSPQQLERLATAGNPVKA